MKYFTLFIAMVWVSCSSVVIPIMADKSVADNIKVLESGEKKIVYLPMVHVGKQPYYDEVKSIVDSLRNDGYQVYYEGVLVGEVKSNMQEDTVRRKFRKLTGIHLTEYKDSANQTLPKIGKNYAVQNHANIGIQRESDSLVDLTMQEIVNRYEAQNGEIRLLECDFATPLNDKYTCKDKEQPQARHTAIYSYRDEYLCKRLVESEDNKILLLYGKSHWTWIYANLVHQNDFTLTQGKL